MKEHDFIFQVWKWIYSCLTFIYDNKYEFDYTTVDKSTIELYLDFCYGLNLDLDVLFRTRRSLIGAHGLTIYIELVRFLTMEKVNKNMNQTSYSFLKTFWQMVNVMLQKGIPKRSKKRHLKKPLDG